MSYTLVKKPSKTDSKIMHFLDAKSLMTLQKTSKIHRCLVHNDTESTKKILNYKLDRANTIANESAVNTYKEINKNWKYLPNNTTKFSDPSKSWKIETTHTNNHRISYILVWNNKSEPELSKAICEIINHKMTAECQAAGMITRIAITCAVLGKERTKQWIANMTTNGTLEINYELMHQLSWAFFKKTDKPKQGEIFAVPFVNIKEYPYFKPNGADSNFNAIGLSNGTYASFGSIFQNKEASHEEFVSFLFEQFKNNEHLDPKRENQHTKFVKKLSYQDFSEKRDQYQGEIGYFALDLVKLATFAN